MIIFKHNDECRINDINMYFKFRNVDCQKAMSIIKLKNTLDYMPLKNIND